MNKIQDVVDLIEITIRRMVEDRAFMFVKGLEILNSGQFKYKDKIAAWKVGTEAYIIRCHSTFYKVDVGNDNLKIHVEVDKFYQEERDWSYLYRRGSRKVLIYNSTGHISRNIDDFIPVLEGIELVYKMNVSTMPLPRERGI